MHESRNEEWNWIGVYLYRADGTYFRARWLKSPQDLVNMLPKIRTHIRSGRDVAITNSADEMLFHATKNGIEWDGLGLEPLLQQEST